LQYFLLHTDKEPRTTSQNSVNVSQNDKSLNIGTKPLFDNVLASAGVSLDPFSEVNLYKDFRTTKITEELQAELSVK
jgi:hypothetical protein